MQLSINHIDPKIMEQMENLYFLLSSINVYIAKTIISLKPTEQSSMGELLSITGVCNRHKEIVWLSLLLDFGLVSLGHAADHCFCPQVVCMC